MSTPNFSYWNANNVYVIEDGGDFLVEDLREGLKSMLENDKSLNVYDRNEHNGNYSYPAVVYTTIEREFEFCGVSMCVSADMIVRSGYYEGYNLDFDIKVSCGNAFGTIEPYEYINSQRSHYGYNSGFDLGVDLVNELIDYNVPDLLGYSKGLFAMNRSRFAKRIEKEIDAMVAFADDLCGKLCEDKYACVGVFSNGEAVYEKVS